MNRSFLFRALLPFLMIAVRCSDDGPDQQPAPNLPKPFFTLETRPIRGFEHVVDAVTKASDVADGVRLYVEQMHDSTGDSIKDVIIEWGDGTPDYSKLNGTFPLGISYVIPHWFVVNPATQGRGTLRATVTSYKGASADTSVPIRVLSKCERITCPPPNPADTGLIVLLRYNGPVYTGTAYSADLGILPATDHVIWIEDSNRTFVKTLLISRSVVYMSRTGTNLRHLPVWTASSGESDSSIRARLAPDSLGMPPEYDAISSASVTFKNPAKGDTTGVADTTISALWTLTFASGTPAPSGLYRFCAEVANIHKDSLADGTPGPDSVVSECSCGSVDTRNGAVTPGPPTTHILGLNAELR